MLRELERKNAQDDYYRFKHFLGENLIVRDKNSNLKCPKTVGRFSV